MIYVDALKPCLQTPTWRYRQSCHLFCDGDLAELHRFALRIGLKRAWFQDRAALPHYDLTARKRELAVHLGAAEADLQTTGRWIRWWRRKNGTDTTNGTDRPAARAYRSERRIMNTLLRFYTSALLLPWLLLAPLAHATTFAAVATEEPVQMNYVYQLAELAQTDPNVPALELLGLPVLSAVRGDPNAWDVPCGPWRRQGSYWDLEGYDVAIEVLAADLPCEASVSLPDKTWTLTVPAVTPDWHVVTVRVTDLPPPETHQKAASRDVTIAFRGMAGPNAQPGLE